MKPEYREWAARPCLCTAKAREWLMTEIPLLRVSGCKKKLKLVKIFPHKSTQWDALGETQGKQCGGFQADATERAPPGADTPWLISIASRKNSIQEHAVSQEPPGNTTQLNWMSQIMGLFPKVDCLKKAQLTAPHPWANNSGELKGSGRSRAAVEPGGRQRGL